MNHRWTEGDIAYLTERYRAGDSAATIAAHIGTTQQCVYVTAAGLGVNKGRKTCIVCHKRVRQPRYGRKRIYCSLACTNLLNSAYAANAHIDGREFTHCVNCGSKLIPPWTSKQKWCSKACGHRGWYLGSYYGGNRDTHYARAVRSKQRNAAVMAMTQDEFDWLYTLRVDGDAPDYWVRKLRRLLDIPTKKDLIRYARAVQVFA